MIYTADGLIKIRKDKWTENKNIEYDKNFRSAVANELINNKSLLDEIKRYPEKLIELSFVVVDKNQQTMPFFLNDVQREFVDTLNKAIDDYAKGLITDISILILKGRQQGFTTLVTAYQLACSILNRNFQGFTLADKSDNSEAIFQNKAKYTYSQLPSALRPTEKFNNRKQLLFEKINSSWAVDTATKDVGRSRTVNFFHGSECAFWKDGIAPIQAALGEAFTKNCIKIYESTANGFNDYQVMWDSGVHINCFYAWWKTKEYCLNFPTEKHREEFITDIKTKEGWIYDRLRWLKEDIKLSLEQLYWYFKKYEGYIDKRLIRQEYPCSPEEAFLLSGETVFDTEKLLARLNQIRRPLRIGYFIYKYDDTKPAPYKISDIKWVNDRNGYIRLYELPTSEAITKYCIGGDTSGDGSDFFTGHVLNARTGNQCAVLKKEFDPHEYTRQMYCLGRYYRNALISIEANFDTFPINELLRLGYYNQYARVTIDTYTKKTEKRFGFRTTALSRPTILSKLIQIVKEDIEFINDEDTIRELLTIIRNEKGKIEAPTGKHDDQMMGLAIAHEAREQVVFEKSVIQQPHERRFNFEKQQPSRGEKGSKINVV